MFALKTLLLDGQPAGCVEIDGRCYTLQDCGRVLDLPDLPASVAALFEDWERSLALLQRIPPQVARLAAHAQSPQAEVLAPLRYPHKVLCAGANYYDHLAEMGVPHSADKSAQRLFFFFKPARQAIVGPGATVRMPMGCTRLDWEVELAMVVGKSARNVSHEAALDHIAAYTVAIDFSARDLNKAPDTFYKLDWVAGKAHDTCCPIGPALVPAVFVRDPQDLGLRLSVNDELKQDARTSGMVFDLREQIVTLSRIMTLEPGDLILTGTPAGVGAPRGTFLQVGDEVTAQIEQLGVLKVRIQAPG